MDTHKLVSEMIDVVYAAGQVTLEIYHQEERGIKYKEDKSPVTAADLAANAIITEALQQLTPNIPIISEEALVPYEDRKDWKTFWLIDPIDGTKEFIKRTGEYTINVGLIENGTPTLGFIYGPVTEELVYGGLRLGESYRFEKYSPDKKDSMRTLMVPYVSIYTLTHKSCSFGECNVPIVVASSKDHRSDYYPEFIENLSACRAPFIARIEELHVGSTLKMVRVAEGKAQLYVRLKGIYDWDLAAGHAIVLGADGNVFDINMQSLVYNTENYRLKPFIVTGVYNVPWYYAVPIQLREIVNQ